MLTVTNHHKTTLLIDGESVRLRIARFTREQHIAFNAEFDFINRESEALQLEVARFRARHVQALAQEQGVAPEAVTSPSGVTLNGLLEAELGAEATTARRAREIALAERGTLFAQAAIASYVSVEPGQIYDESAGREVLTGADLAAVYASRDDVQSELLAAILQQNRLSAQEKKVLSWQHGSPRTSAVSLTDAGPRPATTAAPVAPLTTAAPAAVTDGPATSRSGRTARSRPPSAPSSASRRTSAPGSNGSATPTRSSSATATPGGSAATSPALVASGSRTHG